jgi:DeoR-like helix-turn-helix domain
MLTKRQEYLLDLIQQHGDITVKELLKHLTIGRATLWRDLTFLVQQKKIIQVSHGIYRAYSSPSIYLEKPFYDRDPVSYNFEFLRNYIPNTSYFLSKEQREKLSEATKIVAINTDYYFQNKRLIENILIDLTFASSNLEGNTYSYLDTEVLVKYNEIADDKSKEETQMIINHKKCIEYMMHFKKDL